VQELKEFLDQIRSSDEFRTVAVRAARMAGYDVNSADESISDVLDDRVTVILGQVLFELTDQRFIGRRHHRRKLYNQDCRGPLCRKVERDRSRVRYRKAHDASPKRYNKRASMFDDQILEHVAKKYNALIESNERQKS